MNLRMTSSSLLTLSALINTFLTVLAAAAAASPPRSNTWPPFANFPPLPKPNPPSQGFWSPSFDPLTNFYKCVNDTSRSRIKFSKGFYDPNYNKSSFTALLKSTAENLRCLSDSIQKPKTIFTPTNDKQVQAAVQCAPANGLNIRVRSGGHDYEGLSYISYTKQPFVIVDLQKMKKVKIDIDRNTAWADAGVTVGALYYMISRKSKVLGFPAGLCTDLGIGGHITGGAYGSLMRKHGLGIDHAVDAHIVVAGGKILNRKTMGEDLFWAIRGGGGGNFAIIVRWKLELVTVPETVTYFGIPIINQISQEDGMKVLQKWQSVSHSIDEKLFIRIIIQNVGPNTTINVYQGLYLGNAKDLLKVMGSSFPELGLVRGNCTEMSWIKSVMAMAGFPTEFKPNYLLIGNGTFLNYFKAKSDFVTSPIGEKGLERMLSVFGEGDGESLMILTPYGGKMRDHAEDETAYPHRNVLYKIQYVANWDTDISEVQLKQEAWVRKVYNYMEGYVSKNPRAAYVNYRDLDIGKADPGRNCSDPRRWGPKYYKNNYQRLVKVKTMFDPWNVFNNEQSIPTDNMQYGPPPCISF